jgi:hypothetical protein
VPGQPVRLLADLDRLGCETSASTHVLDRFGLP